MNSIFQVLSLAWSLQGAALPNFTVSAPLEPFFHSQLLYAFDWNVEATYPIFTNQKGDPNGIYLGGGMQNFFTQNHGEGFVPFQDVYRIGAGIKWSGIDIGWEHNCTHSVESDLSGRLASQHLFGAFDKAFIKVYGIF